jgi:hypothetical protein
MASSFCSVRAVPAAPESEFAIDRLQRLRSAVPSAFALKNITLIGQAQYAYQQAAGSALGQQSTGGTLTQYWRCKAKSGLGVRAREAGERRPSAKPCLRLPAAPPPPPRACRRGCDSLRKKANFNKVIESNTEAVCGAQQLARLVNRRRREQLRDRTRPVTDAVAAQSAVGVFKTCATLARKYSRLRSSAWEGFYEASED